MLLHVIDLSFLSLFLLLSGMPVWHTIVTLLCHDFCIVVTLTNSAKRIGKEARSMEAAVVSRLFIKTVLKYIAALDIHFGMHASFKLRAALFERQVEN